MSMLLSKQQLIGTLPNMEVQEGMEAVAVVAVAGDMEEMDVAEDVEDVVVPEEVVEDPRGLLSTQETLGNPTPMTSIRPSLLTRRGSATMLVSLLLQELLPEPQQPLCQRSAGNFLKNEKLQLQKLKLQHQHQHQLLLVDL